MNGGFVLKGGIIGTTAAIAAADAATQIPGWAYFFGAIFTSGAVTVWGNRRKVKAEGDSALVTAANDLAKGVREDMAAIRQEVIDAREKLMAANEETRDSRVNTAKARQRAAELETQMAVLQKTEGERRHEITETLLIAKSKILQLEREVDSLRAKAGLLERRESPEGE